MNGEDIYHLTELLNATSKDNWKFSCDPAYNKGCTSSVALVIVIKSKDIKVAGSLIIDHKTLENRISPVGFVTAELMSLVNNGRAVEASY